MAKSSVGRRDYWNIGLAVVAVVVVVFAGYAGFVSLTRDDASAGYVSNYTPTAGTPAADVKVNGDLSTVRPALQGDQPFTIAVLGDSTGNEDTEWVYLTAQRISDSFNRPVTIHNWLLDSNYYNSENVIGADKPGAPVTIWNGSASGESTDYSLQYFGKLAPETPNLVIINHGHNALSPSAASSGLLRLNSAIARTWTPAPVVAYTLQNPRTDAKAQQQSEVVAVTRTVAESSGAALIDANTPFVTAPDLTPLLRDDDFHPSAEGSRMWAVAVEQALGV